MDDPTCWSCRSDLIVQSDLLVLPERSDWTIRLVGPERSVLIGQSGDLSSGAFNGLLVSQLQIVVREQQENDTRNAPCFATNSPFKLSLRAKQDERPSLLYYFIYPWWSFKTVQYSQRLELSKCDDIVYL